MQVMNVNLQPKKCSGCYGCYGSYAAVNISQRLTVHGDQSRVHSYSSINMEDTGSRDDWGIATCFLFLPGM